MLQTKYSFKNNKHTQKMRSKKKVYFRTCSRCSRFYYTLARWARVCSRCSRTPSKRVWECDQKGEVLKWKNKKKIRKNKCQLKA